LEAARVMATKQGTSNEGIISDGLKPQILTSIPIKQIRMKKPKKIFIIEDNSDHLFMIKALLETMIPEVTIESSRGGQELFDHLFNSHEAISLILLDINLPKMSGLEILQKLKTEERFEAIPVVVVTTSNRREDILQSYLFGANGYVVKSGNYGELRRTFTAIADYWIGTNVLPDRS
jgi:CheY-like chemotaxis protein